MSIILQSIKIFISDVCAGKENETPSAYFGKLLRFDRWLDNAGRELSQLQCEDIEAFKRALLEQSIKHRGARLINEHLSPWTIQTVLKTVKHFLRWAYRKRITDIDLSHFKIPKPPAPDPKAIDAATVLSLLEAASHTGEPWEQARNLALLYTLRDTGSRIGAIIRADIDNLDLNAGKLYIRQKGDRPHNLYLNIPTIEALREWLRYRPEVNPKSHKLFLSKRGGELRRSSIYNIIERIKRNCHPPVQGRTNPHSYRHAWARDALTAGEDLSKVSDTLGHSTIRVTADYYARWSDHELKNAHAEYSPGAHLPIVKPVADLN